MSFGTEKGLPTPNQAAKFSTQQAWPLHQCCQCISAGRVPWGWWSTWLGISTAPLWSGLLNKATCTIARSCRAFWGKILESPHLSWKVHGCMVSAKPGTANPATTAGQEHTAIVLGRNKSPGFLLFSELMLASKPLEATHLNSNREPQYGKLPPICYGKHAQYPTGKKT